MALAHSCSHLCFSELQLSGENPDSGARCLGLNRSLATQHVGTSAGGLNSLCLHFFIRLLRHVLYDDGCRAPDVRAARAQLLGARDQGG